MPAPDYDAIATALALRFANGVTTPAAPGGEADVRVGSATANIPNAMLPLPAVLVFTESGTFPTQGGGTRIGVSRFRVRFYLVLASDEGRTEARLRKWLTVLVQRCKAATSLSGTVDRAKVAEWRLGVIGFADERYDGIELMVDVTHSEGWAAS